MTANATWYRGLKPQLILPFVVISLTTTLLLGASCIWKMKTSLTSALDEKARVLTHSLSNELADPLAMGEYDRLQQIIDTAKPDPDVQFAVVLLPDGRVIACTDPNAKNTMLNRTPFEKEALSAYFFTRRNIPFNNEYFEDVMPVLVRGDKGAVLRVGFTLKNAQRNIHEAELLIGAIGLTALVLGIIVYISITSRAILHPIRYLVDVATRVSRGAMAETVAVHRQDEIGQLLAAMNAMAVDLNKMAQAADGVASGDLTVQVVPRSADDVFGNAFKKMVESLNQSETSAKQLAAIVECSDDAIISVSLSGTIVSWNKGAEKLLGYTASEVVGKPVDCILLEEKRDQFYELVADVQSDSSVEGFESINVRQDGTHVDVSLTISPVKEKDTIVAVAVIGRDITHKKVVEERMREFYAIVSHELRTPLTSIRGALGLISEGIVPADSEEGAELINLAKSSVVRLVRLINDILDLRKIEGGNLDLDLQTIDSTDLVNRGIDSMRGLAQEQGITLTPQLKIKVDVTADSDRATQVLSNLLSNAIKYSPLGSSIKVIVDQGSEPTMVRFSVLDTGDGIPQSEQHKLFGKFQQIDSSDTRAKEGTGLGLAISKAIVEQHGGTIGVESAEGQGSTFWFELRIKAEAAGERKPSGHAGSILVVEDDRELCSVLKVFLGSEGYTCDFANSLGEAFEHLSKSLPDLILLDVKLPDGNGLEVLKHIRNSDNIKLVGVPVIVVTATERNRKDVYSATIVDWLPKPFEYDVLRRALVQAGGSIEGKTVLVVEDDDDTRRVIITELTTLGVTCIGARDGVEAVQLLADNHPDLIILDVAMPRSDGFDVIAKLRGKTHPPPPVLIYSGRELGKQEKDQLRLGLTRYLTKGSVPREQFLSYVKQMLSSALTEEKVGAAPMAE